MENKKPISSHKEFDVTILVILVSMFIYAIFAKINSDRLHKDLDTCKEVLMENKIPIPCLESF